MKKVAFYEIAELIQDAFSRDQTITIPVTGTSMMPLLRPSDAVTLQAVDLETIQRGDILLYRRSDGAYVLHRVVEINTDTMDFCGDNQVDIEEKVSKSQILAQVIAYEKDGIVTERDAILAEGRRRLNSRPLRFAATRYHRARTLPRSKKTSKKSVFLFLYTYLKRRIPVIGLLCLLSSVAAVSTLSMALVSGTVIDKAVNKDMHNFAPWFWLLFALLGCLIVCNILYSNVRVRAVAKLRNDIRHDLFEALLHKQYASFHDMHTGEILNRLTSDIQIVVDNSITLVPSLVALAIKLIGGVAIMMAIEPIFTSIVLVGGILVTLFIQFFTRYYKRAHKECQETEGVARSFLQECVENIVVIKSFVNNRDVLAKLDSYQQDNLKKQIKRNAFANVGNTGLYAGFTFTYYAGLAWGVLRIAGQIGGFTTMTTGFFVTFLQIMEQIRAPFRSASGVLPQILSMVASAERLQELSALPDEPQSLSTEMLGSMSFRALELRDVMFSYEDGRMVFENASASLKKGEFAVLAGSSGVGKTTIIKLLLGLITPQSGELVLTGEHDRNVDSSTRAFFSYVPQGNLLLSGTLRENILFGTNDVTPQELERVLDMACLRETVTSLPNGINTHLGERGVGLSEGQLQRVAIARALLSKAPILLLDECTSALDEQTERQLLNNLRSLHDRTILFISHRTAVFECADTVWSVENGSISVKSL